MISDKIISAVLAAGAVASVAAVVMFRGESYVLEVAGITAALQCIGMACVFWFE